MATPLDRRAWDLRVTKLDVRVISEMLRFFKDLGLTLTHKSSQLIRETKRWLQLMAFP